MECFVTKILKLYEAHLAQSPQCGRPNFVIFNLWFILTYPIDLIWLAFVVNGGGVNITGEPPSMISPIFFILYFYLSWQFHLSNWSGQKLSRTRWRRTPQLWQLKLAIFCLPILILFFNNTYSESFMCLAWMVKKFEFWRTQLDPPLWCPKFCKILSFLHICLSWTFHASSASG